jgi:transposase
MTNDVPEIVSLYPTKVDEICFGGRRNGKRGRNTTSNILVFGILEHEGKVGPGLLMMLKRETFPNLTLKKVNGGNLVASDQFRSCNGLVTYGFSHEGIDQGLKFAREEFCINKIWDSGPLP